MTVRKVIQTEEQNNVTGTSDAFLLSDDAKHINVACVLTSGTPVTGACVEVTLDNEEKITAGTNTWIKTDIGNHTANEIEHLFSPISAVRLNVTDGIWDFMVSQK